MRRKATHHPSFDDLSEAEKEAIYQECEGVTPESGSPLNARDRRLHRKAGLRVGRPKVGQGAERINISMERGLLKMTDAAAKRLGISRARLIAESVQAYLKGAA